MSTCLSASKLALTFNLCSAAAVEEEPILHCERVRRGAVLQSTGDIAAAGEPRIRRSIPDVRSAKKVYCLHAVL